MKLLFRKIFENHLVMSGFYKGVSGLSLFISIPVLIQYLGQDTYGVWLLIYALFQLVLIMDFGIQSNLKTKIPVFYYNNQTDSVVSYIKSTYKISVFIAIGIFLIAAVAIYASDLKDLLNITTFSSSFINEIFLLNIFLFCLNFITGIHKSLYVAFLKGKYAEESLAVNQLGILVLIIIATIAFPDIDDSTKIIVMTLLHGFFSLLVNIAYTIRFSKMQNINFLGASSQNQVFTSDILKLGCKFMILQVGMLIFFIVDNYIISNNFMPKDVVPYDSVNRIFQLPLMLLFAALTPLWSMFYKNYADRDQKALLGTFKKFNIYFVAITVAVIVLALICPFIIHIWIKQELKIPNLLIFYIAIVTLMRIFVAFYSNFLYGVGRLNIFIFIIVITVLLKIPLTYFLMGHGYGINSVVIATSILMIPWVVGIPLQSYMIVRRLA
ncbi:MAG: oligosaccharide flippase family protein [Flavobacterium sp.]|nr:oligosaccharide flippase family protein [Flavobacterium sp.]